MNDSIIISGQSEPYLRLGDLPAKTVLNVVEKLSLYILIKADIMGTNVTGSHRTERRTKPLRSRRIVILCTETSDELNITIASFREEEEHRDGACGRGGGMTNTIKLRVAT